MTLKEILISTESAEVEIDGTLSVEDKLTLTESLTLVATEAQVVFTGQDSSIQLLGHGPFRFRGLHFHHDEALGPTFFHCEDAVVVFEDCSFRGAYGGEQDALASAVKARGRSRLSFERCHFQGNDLHLQSEQNATCDLKQCTMQEARADGIRVQGQSEFCGLELEISSSGWSGISGSGQSRLRLSASNLRQNACDGAEFVDNSNYHGSDNIFSENGQNGLSFAGNSTALSQDEHFLSNRLCGLDSSGDALGLIKGALASHNLSHGYQVRDTGRLNLLDSYSGDNQGSGLALYHQASVQTEDLQCESNTHSGIQATDNSRLTLYRANLSQNGASGLVSFGRARVIVERSRINDSGAYAIQLAEDSQGLIRDCELMENRKGGMVLAGSSLTYLEGNTVAHNSADGIICTEQSKLTAVENLIRSNERDGILILSAKPIQILENLAEKNGRYGIFAGSGTQALLSENTCTDNQVEQVCLETKLGRAATRGTGSEQSVELPSGVTLVVEGAADLHLPFEPKDIERSMLLALAKHGRLSEHALGKVAKTRRVSGAMENLIARLNEAGMPLIRHDGDGPEGNIYAFKVDTSRTRNLPQRTSETQGREIC